MASTIKNMPYQFGNPYIKPTPHFWLRVIVFYDILYRIRSSMGDLAHP